MLLLSLLPRKRFDALPPGRSQVKSLHEKIDEVDGDDGDDDDE